MHENTAFGPWHRPYMRLYETHLKNACTRVATTIPLDNLRSEAQYICDTLRAPYWDTTELTVPAILTQATVRVLAVDSGLVTKVDIRNPLTYYTFRVSSYSLHASAVLCMCCLCRMRCMQANVL
jgi:tyrosinase